MKYSVVIPLYNKEHYIAGTLRSVLTQTFPDYEVIVVDDGSTDHSLQACKTVQSDKIRIVQQANQGVSAARNKGIELAAGEYICFLDADDTWHPDYLQNIETIVQKYPQSDIFVTAYRVIYANGRCKESRRLPQANGCLPSYWETLGKGYDFVWTSATTVRRTALLAAGEFRLGEKIGQDLDLWARLARNNPCVAYASRVCVDYNRGAEANARTRVKVAHAKAFMQDLEEELKNPNHSKAEIAAIQRKYDLKMTVYIYTSLIAGQKHQAKQALSSWKGRPNLQNILLRAGLGCAALLPAGINAAVYQVRLALFGNSMIEKMSVYLVLCLLLAYPARLCVLARRQGRSAQRVALAMSCVVLWFFMAMRAQTVGVDTKYYVCIYQQFPQISWKELFTAQLYPTPRRTWELDLEPGYRLLNKLLSIYLPAPQWITVANSALIIALLYRWLRRESPNAMLSIWLYLTLGVYQTEMNVARNAIAILLGYTAFHWIKERKLAPYFLQILMAVSFHKSAVVFLPLYWLVNRRWKYRHVLYCTMAAGILGAAYPVVAGRVANLLPYALAKYFTKSNSRMESIAVGAFYALLVAFVLYKMTPEECKKLESKEPQGLFLTMAALSLYGLNLGLASAARMAALFGPYLIVLLPRMLEYINCPRRRAATIQWLAVAAGLQYVLRLLINNIGGTMPYQFFWAA